MQDRGPWILTHTGRKFHFLDPTAADIDLADIAHSLSHLCRFNGHCTQFYSVAQHSLLVESLVDKSSDLGVYHWALLHDAAEAYIGDITRPLKRQINVTSHYGTDSFGYIENQINRAIAERFGLYGASVPPQVKQADLVALAIERRDIMPDSDEPWPCLEGVEIPYEWMLPRRVSDPVFFDIKDGFLMAASRLRIE